MKKIAPRGFCIAVCLYTIIHYISYFFAMEFLMIMLSVLGFLVISFSIIYLPIRKSILPIFLICSSIIIQLATNHPVFIGTLEGLRQMRSIIGLLIIVPMISWVLQDKPYIEEIMSFSHKFLNTSRKFYFGLMGITQLIAYFLLFGAIPMMYQFISEFFKDQTGEALENFKGTALLRAFSLSTLWVISIPSFLIAVDMLGASLISSVLQGFIISFFGIILAVIFSYFQEKNYNINITKMIEIQLNKVMHNNVDQNQRKLNVITFIGMFFSLFGTIFVLHISFNWDLLVTIPPVIVLWTCIYYLIRKRRKKLLKQTKQYFTTDLAKKAQELTILLSAGLLIHSLNESGLGSYVIDSIFFLSNIIPFLNLLWILPFVVIFLGFIGLGPLTVMVLVAGILENITLPYSPELVLLSITSGSVISILMSPFILPIIVLSSSNGLGVFKNGIRFNIRYAVAFYLFVQLYLQIRIHFHL